ncbi:Fusaric acid resistance protein-like [Streptomyces sp. LamerLS-316]|uniref:FUSC family protein n=1 Tax=unclassified Streptomyces TaxID=2593676 RepID=UPI000823D066|nr:FUSC family protein [Streptomyces sp. LamerLS-316]SCK18769.1 Fusaric acid resistance protein-like [Streptomyces sp. LamerLS-316]
MIAKAGRQAILRRALRITLAALAGFYPLLYAADRPTAALYALFAPIAVGLLSAIPGSGRRQALVVLRVLPPALALAALGTALAVNTWAASGGMLAVGFLLAFAAVAGPRAAGAAPGLQLFYILACFPPYDPDALGDRLTGLTVGILLLAATEILLPDPPVPAYRQRLADAIGTAARGASDTGVPAQDLREAGARMRLSRLPPSERPAGASRTDRALDQAGRAVRRLLDQLAALAELPPAADPASAALLCEVATVCDACAQSLRTGRPPPVPGALEQAMRGFQSARVHLASGASAPGPPGPPPPTTGPPPPTDVLRRQSRVLALAESARIVEVAVDIAANGPPAGRPSPHDLFWYAELSTPTLWARRVLGNMTLRSVLFQNAVRIALGLAAARLVAGSLDLAHGFWVLLAVLTLGRTTVGAAWKAVREALVGNAVGALAAGALLIGLGSHTDAYAALLAPAMLLGFSLGPLLGIAYAQGLFTLVVATAFAQMTPVTWQLSEARMIDVATGSAIGLLCGLLAWPAGARREAVRAMAGLLRTCGTLVPPTAQNLLTPSPVAPTPPRTLPSLHRLRLAEAAYAQYRSESGTAADDTGPDWHAVLLVADHILMGVYRLPRFGLRPGNGPSRPCADWARTSAARLDRETGRIASLLIGERPAPGAPLVPPPEGCSPATLSVDLEMWMTSLGLQLTRLEASVARAHGSPAPQGDRREDRRRGSRDTRSKCRHPRDG